MGQPATVKDLLTAALAQLEDTPDWTHKHALARALPTLRKAAVSFAEAKDRNEARKVYQLAAAALRIDHE